tara:strand:- start:1829 stop:3685 length:1857 start_codon:yes stop_codon:yes gene_type:complete
MCGIFGCVGEKDVSSLIIKGLKRLEYRGYDSAGLCLETDDSNFEILKSSNSNYPVDVLSKSLEKSKISSNAGIGHTRWATHGPINNINTHPHFSYSKNISIVHNGIVENYDFLSKFLIRKGVNIFSQTDSELIAHLVDLMLCSKGNLQSAIFSVSNMLEGSNTVALMSKEIPQTIFGFTTNSSGGLVVGEKNNYRFLSSDSYALENFCDSVSFTSKDDLVIISNNSLKIIDQNNLPTFPKNINLIKDNNDNSHEFKDLQTNFIIEKEISEQNGALKKIIKKRILDKPQEAFPEINRHRLLSSRKIIFTGMGSSYHAAQYGSLLFEDLLEIDTKVEFSSELKNKKIISPDQTTVFAITQSGETADTIEAIRNAKQQGAYVISIVEESNSKAAINSDSYLLLETGKEISVAATKTFTSTLLMCNSICIYLASLLDKNNHLITRLKEDFMKIDNNMQKVLDCCDYDYLKVSKFISDSEKVFFIGKNLSFPIVNEGSLKIQEISKINSNSFIEGELKHGPNALLDKNSTIISIIGPGENINKSISSLREIASRNANIITISFVENSEIQDLSNYSFVIENNNKYIFPILSVIPLQKLAFMSALNLGLDPDRPQNLAKTVTVE